MTSLCGCGQKYGVLTVKSAYKICGSSSRNTASGLATLQAGWKPPPLNFVKLNTDAAFREEGRGSFIGYVLRNSDGHILKAFAGALSFGATAVGETMAIRHGLISNIQDGRGYQGNLIPGCPETFQSSPQGERFDGGHSERERGHRFRDQHQRIQRIRQGDFLAIPHGIAHWIYNDGDEQLELVSFYDTRNHHNQLDQRLRKFFLAGNPQGQERERDEETARRLQGENDDNRGAIVHVERGLQVIRPSRGEEEEEGEQGERRGRRYENGLEETICNARLRENVDNPTRADVYSKQGGHISSLNSHKLPILNYLQLSAERGVLYANAILAQHWNINAHSVIYVTRGSARVQIVGNRGERVFDEEVREGQILVVPQNFAVATQANNEGFEWVSFKTNDNAISSQLAGRTSVLRALPEEVLMNAYHIRREEAKRIKYGRNEVVVLSPRDQGLERASA
ncbi:hypothetical protein NE237_012243 [Protea cynaroides]|uniref:Cupin type-1 domain-containing protein n=1 Tax=Protea cynaroides TaxID=273540 RepID=A0A9Q0JYM2_9MAGN|nr:hypothetical protein NE237_012243 [Protea cynaroides]